MTQGETILQNALLLSYLHSKMACKNMEVVLIEVAVTHPELKGRIQSKFEKLIGAHRNAMAILERNIENKELLENDINEMIDNNWKELHTPTEG